MKKGKVVGKCILNDKIFSKCQPYSCETSFQCHRSHSGERPHWRLPCPKVFTDSSVLRTHVRKQRWKTIQVRAFKETVVLTLCSWQRRSVRTWCAEELMYGIGNISHRYRIFSIHLCTWLALLSPRLRVKVSVKLSHAHLTKLLSENLVWPLWELSKVVLSKCSSTNICSFTTMPRYLQDVDRKTYKQLRWLTADRSARTSTVSFLVLVLVFFTLLYVVTLLYCTVVFCYKRL